MEKYFVLIFDKISTLNISSFQESLNLNIVESDIAALSEDQVAKKLFDIQNKIPPGASIS